MAKPGNLIAVVLLVSLGSLPSASASCNTPNAGDAAKCDLCNSGFFLNATSQVCQACPANCLVCSSGDTCSKCTAGYAPTVGTTPTTCEAICFLHSADYQKSADEYYKRYSCPGAATSPIGATACAWSCASGYDSDAGKVPTASCSKFDNICNQYFMITNPCKKQCVLPTVVASKGNLSGGDTCVSGGTVKHGTSCTLTKTTDFNGKCHNVGTCNDGAVDSRGCVAHCSVPTTWSTLITDETVTMSGSYCSSGSTNVQDGTTCTINRISGYKCTSPGKCTDGSFENPAPSCQACTDTNCDQCDEDVSKCQKCKGHNVNFFLNTQKQCVGKCSYYTEQGTCPSDRCVWDANSTTGNKCEARCTIPSPEAYNATSCDTSKAAALCSLTCAAGYTSAGGSSILETMKCDATGGGSLNIRSPCMPTCTLSIASEQARYDTSGCNTSAKNMRVDECKLACVSGYDLSKKVRYSQGPPVACAIAGGAFEELTTCEPKCSMARSDYYDHYSGLTRFGMRTSSSVKDCEGTMRADECQPRCNTDDGFFSSDNKMVGAVTCDTPMGTFTVTKSCQTFTNCSSMATMTVKDMHYDDSATAGARKYKKCQCKDKCRATEQMLETMMIIPDGKTYATKASMSDIRVCFNDNPQCSRLSSTVVEGFTFNSRVAYSTRCAGKTCDKDADKAKCYVENQCSGCLKNEINAVLATCAKTAVFALMAEPLNLIQKVKDATLAITTGDVMTGLAYPSTTSADRTPVAANEAMLVQQCQSCIMQVRSKLEATTCSTCNGVAEAAKLIKWDLSDDMVCKRNVMEKLGLKEMCKKTLPTAQSVGGGVASPPGRRRMTCAYQTLKEACVAPSTWDDSSEPMKCVAPPPPAPAAANVTGNGTGNATGNATGTASSNTSTAVVKFIVTLAALDYDKLVANASAKAAVVLGIKHAVLESLTGYTTADLDYIKVVLSKGSVKATIEVTPKSGMTAADLNTDVTAKKATMQTAVVTKTKAVPGVADFLEDGKSLDDLTVTVSDPTVVGGDPVTQPPRGNSKASLVKRLLEPAVLVLASLFVF